MDEVALTERLVAFDTSDAEGLRRAAEFVGGWLESREIKAKQTEARGLPVTMAEVGPKGAPTLVMHGHLDVVPGRDGQFDRRIWGGDALNKVPDLCVIDVDVRFLPDQDPDEILEQVDSLPDTRLLESFRRQPAVVEAESPFVQGLCEAASPHHPERVMSVGRDGASDVVSFLRAGVPAVEFRAGREGRHRPPGG